MILNIEKAQIYNERANELQDMVKNGARIIQDLTTVKNKLQALLSGATTDGYSQEDLDIISMKLADMKTALTKLANSI